MAREGERIGFAETTYQAESQSVTDSESSDFESAAEDLELK
jgi:hypothetical protein